MLFWSGVTYFVSLLYIGIVGAQLPRHNIAGYLIPKIWEHEIEQLVLEILSIADNIRSSNFLKLVSASSRHKFILESYMKF